MAALQSTGDLASQLELLGSLVLAEETAALDEIPPCAESQELESCGVDTEEHSATPSSADEYGERDGSHRQTPAEIRRALDRQAMRFVDESSPMTRDALKLHGFDSPSHAIIIAHDAHILGILSFEPAKMLVASALALIEGASVSIADICLKFGTRGLGSFRYTYHPMEELRIQAEIDRLRVDSAPFKNVSHLSLSAQVRILEQMALVQNLPHPRLLGFDHFKMRLPGWKAQCQGLYKHYSRMWTDEHGAGGIVDFMLDHLGVQRFEELSLAEQARFIGLRYQRIHWDKISVELKRHLLFRLANEAGVVHPRFLTFDHFRDIEMPELSSTLIGLYNNYLNRGKEARRIIDALLDDVGVPSFEILPWDVQLKGLLECELIKWERMPASTQVKLLEIARGLLPEQNGLKCPHLRAMPGKKLNEIVLDELGATLSGLLEHYWLRVPEGYGGSALDFMLDQLGVERFEDLSYEQQCLCLRYNRNWPWEKVPLATILRLMERVQELNGLPHVRFVSCREMESTVVPEIGQSLKGLYTHFSLRKTPDDSRVVVDKILDYCGVSAAEEMPFALQLRLAERRGGKLSGWRRVPDSVIAFYLAGMMCEAGAKDAAGIVQGDFRSHVGERNSGLMGLYGYLRNLWRGSESEGRMIDWAFSHYGMDVYSTITTKRRSGGGIFLDQREKMLLLWMAKSGDRQALDHLIFFYEPLMAGIASSVMTRFGGANMSFGALLQAGRIELHKLAQRYDPSIASFETYVKRSLSLTLFKMMIQRGAAARREVSFSAPLDEEDGDFTLEGRVTDLGEVGPDHLALRSDAITKLDMAIEGSGLSDREKIIVLQCHLAGHTHEEVGGMLGLSKERIRRLSHSALEKIAKGPYASVLRELL